MWTTVAGCSNRGPPGAEGPAPLGQQELWHQDARLLPSLGRPAQSWPLVDTVTYHHMSDVPERRCQPPVRKQNIF